jgi:hypothetical protein
MALRTLFEHDRKRIVERDGSCEVGGTVAR